MDSYETLQKYSNFGSNEKFGSLSGLISDPCNLTRDEIESTKQLKYYTRNFFDENIVQNRGIFFNDGFGIPSCEIDHSTTARLGTVTNKNLIQNLPSLPLPTTASFSKGQGSVTIEDKLRPGAERQRKQCNPRDTEYYNRSFYIFDNLPIKPNECVDNVVQKGPMYRQGVSTRVTHYNNNKK